jgi:hypothetical protein
VYLMERPASGLPFLPDYLPLLPSLPPVASHLAPFLPAFAHTLGFALLTAGVIAAGKVGAVTSVASWGLINLGFEVGQHPAISPWIVGRLLGEHGASPLLDLARCYFQHGTFDPRDVWAVVAGVGVGYIVASRTHGSYES